MGVVAVHAAHVTGSVAGWAPLVQGRGVAGAAVFRVGTDRNDLRRVVGADFAVAGFARNAFGVEFTRRGAEVRGVAQQAVLRLAHILPALLEVLVVEGMGMRAVRPEIGDVQVAFAAVLRITGRQGRVVLGLRGSRRQPDGQEHGDHADQHASDDGPEVSFCVGSSFHRFLF